MHSFINAIFSLLPSSLEPYRSQNTYTPQMQPNAHPVDKKPWYSSAGSANVSYCHHKRTASAGSTEYWVWNGPEGNNPDLDDFTIPSMFESSSPISLSEISTDSVTYLEADNTEASPRLDSIDRCVTPSSDDVPNLTLDTSTIITTTGTDDFDTTTTTASSTSSEPPSTPDLPSDSFSPLLRANRLALDADASWKTSRFGMATATPTAAGEESRPLCGLGIFDVSRKEDPLHAFDGLGIVRIQSSPWRSVNYKHGDDFSDEQGDGEQDDAQPEYCQHISETFLHDLEAFFLVRDFTPSPSTPLSFSNQCSGDKHDGGLTFDITIEEPITTESGEGNPSSMLTAIASTVPPPIPAAGYSCLPSHTSTPASKDLDRRIRNALSLTPRRAAKPPSDFCAIGPSIPPTQASSCLIATSTPALSTANSSYALTPSSSSFSSSSSSSSSTSFGIPTSSSGSRSAFVRRTCSAFTLSRHDTCSSFRTRHHRGADTVSPSASARNLTVSVSMGPSPSPDRDIKSHRNGNGVVALGLGNRSLQSHSVRDLSVIGTISSDLKRKMSSSGSSTSFGPGSGVRI